MRRFHVLGNSQVDLASQHILFQGESKNVFVYIVFSVIIYARTIDKEFITLSIDARIRDIVDNNAHFNFINNVIRATYARSKPDEKLYILNPRLY